MPTPLTSLLTLPLELRLKIYILVLDPPTYLDPTAARTALIPNLSLLLTSHQIYHETRTLPLELYPLSRRYSPPPADFLPSHPSHPFQLTALRRLRITYLDPLHLQHFVRTSNGWLFGAEGMRLDTLTIHADDWITRDLARRWRTVVSKEDVCYDLPRSSRWLLALCALQGWTMLEIVFSTRDLATEYWERGRFITPLFEEFRHAIGNGNGDGDGRDGQGPPRFTAWHKQDWAPYDGKIAVLRTADIHLHGFPEWREEDVGRLRGGAECVVREKWPEVDDFGDGVVAMPREAGFHVGEVLGDPEGRKERFCGRCRPVVSG